MVEIICDVPGELNAVLLESIGDSPASSLLQELAIRVE